MSQFALYLGEKIVKQHNSFCSIVALVALLAACGSGQDDADANGFGQSDESPSAEANTASQPTSAAPQRINVGDRTLSAPTDFQMAVAFYQIVGLEPPFNDWARADPRARQANEFQRAAVATRIQEELLLAARAVTGVGFVELNAGSNFGEYDMAAQGFRLTELDNDRYYSWNYGGNQYRLTMENGNEAQLWRIPQADAQRLVENSISRRANLKLRFRITGALPESNGGGTLQGRVVGYEVFDQNGNKVGEMTFQ